jgi:hypothetical protein
MNKESNSKSKKNIDIKKKELSTGKDYTTFVREFVTLLNKEFNIWEERVKNQEKLHELANKMPALISMVNTVGYLRGQDNIFVDIRPYTKNQGEFYNYEDLFEKRLQKLINALSSSKEENRYQERLQKYFIETRTK